MSMESMTVEVSKLWAAVEETSSPKHCCGSKNESSLDGVRVTYSDGSSSLAKLVLLLDNPHQTSHFFFVFSESLASL